MSELDIARKLFGTNASSVSNSAPSRIQNKGSVTIGHSSTRYGTVQEIDDNGLITVLLDGSDSPIYGYCETPVVVNQRVSVVFDNGTVTIVALTHFVDNVSDEFTNVRQEIEDKGQEIIDGVADDIQAVQDSLDDFKATHSYDDATIDTKFKQAEDTITANVEASIGDEFVTDAELEIAVGQIESTVSENYQSKTDAGTMQSNLQSQITQNANAITQEVSDRKTAVSGAITESKTYTDTTAEGLTTSITQSVMNEVGETYTKQADFEFTVDGMTQTFTQSINTVDDKADAAQSAATAAQSTANTAKTTANQAKSTADSVNQIVSTVITTDADGVTVGRSDLNTKARVSSQSEFQILDGSSKITSIGRNEIHLAQNVSNMDTAKIYMLNDVFQINTEPADLKYTDGFYDLSIAATDSNLSTTDAKSISIKMDDDNYVSIDTSLVGLPTASHRINIKGDGVNLFGGGTITIYPDGPVCIQGDTLKVMSDALLKPACSIGASAISVQLGSANSLFPANREYGAGDSKRGTGLTSIYRSGNYIYVDVAKRFASSEQYQATYLPIEVAAQVTTQNVDNSNVAVEIKIEHVSGSAGALSVDTIASPIHTGSLFVPAYVIPTVVQLPRGAYNASSSYDRYRIYVQGRCTNASALLTNWILTVKML